MKSLKNDRWDVNNHRLSNVSDPVVGQDATTLNFVNDRYLNKSTGGSIHGGVNMNDNDLFGLQNPPKFDTSAVSSEYLATYVYIHLDETLFWNYFVKYGVAL